MTDSGVSGDLMSPIDRLAAMVSENVRTLRNNRGWSIAEAAAASNIGKSTFAQLESGRANPSLETLYAVATAFGVPVGTLVGSNREGTRLLKAGTGTTVQSGSHPYRIQLLLSLTTLRGIEVSLLETEPGPPRVSEPHLPGAVEHIFLVQGVLCAGPIDDPAMLEPGDLMSFAADVKHVYDTLAEGTQCLVFMEYR